MASRGWQVRLPRAHAAVEALVPRLDALRLALFILILVNISRMHEYFGIIGRLRPAFVATGVALICVLLQPKLLSFSTVMRYWPGKILFGFFIFACLSVPFGISQGGAGNYLIEEYSKIILAAFLVAAATPTARELFVFVWGYVASVAALGFMSLFVFKLHSYDGYSRLASMFSYDSNDAGLALLVGLPLATLTLQTSRRFGRIVSATTIITTAAAIARTGSRGALVGMGVVGVLFLFALRHIAISKRIAVLVAAVVAIFAFAPPGYWRQMSTVLRPEEDYNWTTKDGRKEVALRGLGYMMAYPVFGIGINNFEKAECVISDKARDHVDGQPLRCTAPHNSWVQAGSELGVGGLLMWAALLFGGVFSMRRLQKRLPAYWESGTREERFLYLAPPALSLAMIGFIITSTFLSFAWLDVVYTLAAYMAGLYAAIEHRMRRQYVGSPPHSEFQC
ncbi:MAG: O-antigen ligase family protein [Gemmatimonadaceae bacterium]